jgi:hypothetical protein
MIWLFVQFASTILLAVFSGIAALCAGRVYLAQRARQPTGMSEYDPR